MYFSTRTSLGKIRLNSLVCGALLIAFVLLLPFQAAYAQDSSSADTGSNQNESEFKLRTGTNLVVVRVVVTNRDGKTVENLKKEDFRLFDNGKEQPVAQFENKETATTASSSPDINPSHFVALFFDDIDVPLLNLIDARDQADRFLTTYIRPSDRVALITTSGTTMVEFTSDTKKLREELIKIQPNSHGGDPRLDGWRNLQTLDQLVMRLSQMPGERSIVIVSTGFMSASQQVHVDAIINRALRSQVVVSALDPRGLVTEGGGPAELVRGSPAGPYANGPQNRAVTSSDAVDSLDPDVLIPAEAVLREMADGTGGTYFDNNNDLTAGFHQLSGTAQNYYILAFHPQGLKEDGKYHALKVELATKHSGFSVQARHGYFAPNQLNPKNEEEEKIHDAIVSANELQQLPVILGAKVSEGSAGTRELSLFAHLDARPLHFRKEAEHNLNTVTFIFGIFDQDGNLVGLRQRKARVDVLNAQMEDLFKVGIDADMTFQLKPGIYRVRQVVINSEDQRMATISRNVKIP